MKVTGRPTVISLSIHRRRAIAIIGGGIGLLCATGSAFAQAIQYFAGDGSAVTASKYKGTATGASSSFTSAFIGGSIFAYGNAADPGTGTGGPIVVGGFNFSQSFTLTPAASKTISNFNDGIVEIAVSSGKTADFGTQVFAGSDIAGYTKIGDGTVALAGGSYGGTFTLNAGTVIVRGMNALGNSSASPTHSLVLNGGVVASNASRDLSGRFLGGVTVGGDVQFGASTGLASGTANLSFNDVVSLGTSTRTLTIGNSGINTFAGVVSGSGGLTIAAVERATGTMSLINDANDYTGDTTISSGTLSLSTGSADINNNIKKSKVITVESGAKLKVSAVGGGDEANQFQLQSGQRLRGTGTVTGGVQLASGSVVSPGVNSADTLTVTTMRWESGGTYEAEVASAASHDLIMFTGDLAIKSTSDAKFNVTTLGGGTSLAGAGWIPIAVGTSTLVGFSADKFQLPILGDGSAYQIRATNSDGISDYTGGSGFQIQISETADAPEPGTACLFGVGVGGLLMSRRRRPVGGPSALARLLSLLPYK